MLFALSDVPPAPVLINARLALQDILLKEIFANHLKALLSVTTQHPKVI